MQNPSSSTTYTSESYSQSGAGMPPVSRTVETLTRQEPGTQPVTLVSEHTGGPTGNFANAQMGQMGAIGQGTLGQGAIGQGAMLSQPMTNQPMTGQPTFARDSLVHPQGMATVTFRPLEGKFVKDKDIIGKMDPYCKIKIGWHSGKSSVAKSQGTHPVWNDVITLNRKHGEQFARLKVKDRDRVTLNDRLGSVKINLDDIAARGKVTQWFTLTKGDQVTGEVLMDIEYHGNPTVV